MSYDAKTERLIALKKLAGKAQTSNDKGLSNEALPSGITSTSETIFGETISTAPSSTSLYTITGKVEYVRFPASFIAGSDTSDGRHGFELTLPSDYESNSSNTKAGTYPFVNSQTVNITSGSLQLVPTSFATSYEIKPYYGGTSAKDSGTQIPLLDARDWYMDYFNGVFFQQDPSGTGDQADNPDFVEGFLYIGDMLDTVVSNAGIAGASFFTSPANGFLNTTGSAAFAGSLGSSYVASSVGDDVNFFVSGSVDSRDTSTRGASAFGGDVVVSGTLSVNRGQAGVGSMFTITSDGKVGIGSDTPSHKLSVGGNMDLGEYLYHKNDTDTFIRFEDDAIHMEAGGKSFLKLSQAGTNKLILNNGQADVDLQVKSKGSANVFRTDAFNNSVYFGDNAGAGVDNNFWVSGSIGTRGSSTRGTAVFGGDLFTSGSAIALGGLSGSLTHLVDGTSYLVAGDGIAVSSGSSGKITITNSLPSGVRDKIVYEITSSHSSGTPVTISSADFSIGKYNPDLIDMYLNGALLMSGSGNDYILSPSSNNKVTFNFLLENEDLVTAVIEESGGASTSSSSTSPGGTNTQVQFNDGGAFGGDSGFLYNKTSNDLYVEGVLTGSMGLSGSLTRLSDGTSYIVAGNNVTVTSASNGQVTVASSGPPGTGDYQIKTVDFTVSSTEYMIGINTSSGAVTGTLEAAAIAGTGRQLIFKDAGGYAGNTSKGILISPNGSEKIDGGSCVNILVNSGSVSLLSDGSGWLVFGVA